MVLDESIVETWFDFLYFDALVLFNHVLQQRLLSILLHCVDEGIKLFLIFKTNLHRHAFRLN